MAADFSERIRQLRGKTSQREFAERIGVNINSLRHYEKGARRPNVDILENICKYTGASPTWLVLGEGPVKLDQEGTFTAGGQVLGELEALKAENAALRQKIEDGIAHPKAEEVIPVLELQASDLKGWQKVINTRMYTEGPTEIGRETGLAIMSQGDTQVLGGILPGTILIGDQSVPPRVGDIVFTENREGYGIAAILCGDTEVDGEQMTNLVCWLASDPLNSFQVSVKKSDIKRQVAVVFFRRR